MRRDKAALAIESTSLGPMWRTRSSTTRTAKDAVKTHSPGHDHARVYPGEALLWELATLVMIMLPTGLRANGLVSPDFGARRRRLGVRASRRSLPADGVVRNGLERQGIDVPSPFDRRCQGTSTAAE